MHALNRCLIPIGFLAALLLLTMPTPALAYAGPGPGLEMIPYFFSLLTWAGIAVGATLAWPVSSLLRRVWPGAAGSAEVSGDPAAKA